VTLPELVIGELAGKFGEISLFNHHADFELESASNSNSTSPWAIEGPIRRTREGGGVNGSR
jgi:hypothetical protein